MAVDLLTTVEIARPRQEVFAFAADPDNATTWYKNIKTVEWETPPPVVIGSRIRFSAQFLGRTLDYTYEVREIDRGRRFVMATAQGAISNGDDLFVGRRSGRYNKNEPAQSRRAVRLRGGDRAIHGVGHA